MVLLSSGDMYIQLIGALLIFLVILVITALTTRYVGGVQKSLGQSGNIEIKEVAKIGPNKYIQIVRVGKKYICIAVTQEHVTMLSEMSEEELSFDTTGTNKLSFSDIFKKAQKKEIEESDFNHQYDESGK